MNSTSHNQTVQQTITTIKLFNKQQQPTRRLNISASPVVCLLPPDVGGWV